MAGKKIEEARNDIIGLKLIDFMDDGDVLFFEDTEGRSYSIDFTGKDGAVVNRGLTRDEEIEHKLILLNLLLEKLDISEEELWELYV